MLKKQHKTDQDAANFAKELKAISEQVDALRRRLPENNELYAQKSRAPDGYGRRDER